MQKLVSFRECGVATISTRKNSESPPKDQTSSLSSTDSENSKDEDFEPQTPDGDVDDEYDDPIVIDEREFEEECDDTSGSCWYGNMPPQEITTRKDVYVLSKEIHNKKNGTNFHNYIAIEGMDAVCEFMKEMAEYNPLEMNFHNQFAVSGRPYKIFLDIEMKLKEGVINPSRFGTRLEFILNVTYGFYVKEFCEFLNGLIPSLYRQKYGLNIRQDVSVSDATRVEKKYSSHAVIIRKLRIQDPTSYELCLMYFLCHLYMKRKQDLSHFLYIEKYLSPELGDLSDIVVDKITLDARKMRSLRCDGNTKPPENRPLDPVEATFNNGKLESVKVRSDIAYDEQWFKDSFIGYEEPDEQYLVLTFKPLTKEYQEIYNKIVPKSTQENFKRLNGYYGKGDGSGSDFHHKKEYNKKLNPQPVLSSDEENVKPIFIHCLKRYYTTYDDKVNIDSLKLDGIKLTRDEDWWFTTVYAPHCTILHHRSSGKESAHPGKNSYGFMFNLSTNVFFQTCYHDDCKGPKQWLHIDTDRAARERDENATKKKKVEK